jgi:hypothetical protein
MCVCVCVYLFCLSRSLLLFMDLLKDSRLIGDLSGAIKAEKGCQQHLTWQSRRSNFGGVIFMDGCYQEDVPLELGPMPQSAIGHIREKPAPWPGLPLGFEIINLNKTPSPRP